MKYLIRGVVVVACLTTMIGIADARILDGSGKLKTESRTVKPFSTLFVDAPIDVIVSVGEPQTVTVAIDDNLQDAIVVDVSHGELRITSKGEWSTKLKGKVRISIPALMEVYTSSLANMTIHNLSGKLFNLYYSGLGEVNLSGKVESLEIESDGWGVIDARRLFAESADVASRSSGDVIIWAQKSVYATTIADGDIECFGNPHDLVEERGGTGDVIRR
jgi:Putative auto-transporter adhesin, head GIN domain